MSQSERNGRTPFRMQLKFTPEEWRAFGLRANEANTSRYNFGKRAILGRADGQVEPTAAEIADLNSDDKGESNG